MRAGFPILLSPESRRASPASPRCSSSAPPCRRPLGSPHASFASPWRQKAAAHEASAFKVDEGTVLVEKVEVRTKRPRSKSTKAVYFSSLTLLMAAASGRMVALQKTCHSRRLRSSWRPQAAAWRKEPDWPYMYFRGGYSASDMQTGLQTKAHW